MARGALGSPPQHTRSALGEESSVQGTSFVQHPKEDWCLALTSSTAGAQCKSARTYHNASLHDGKKVFY